MSLTLFILPTVHSESISGLICKSLTTEEEALVKRNLMMFLDVNIAEVTWFDEPLVNPLVRSSTMKHLLAMFESYIHKHEAESRLDIAIRLVVNNSTLPSEILEGLAFVRKRAMEDTFPPQASGAEDGVICVQLASALVTLLNKLTFLEICDARVGKEKTEAARAMGCLLFKNPCVARYSERIIECLKVICPSENGTELVDFMCKQSEVYVQGALEFNNVHNFGLKGKDDLGRVGFLTKWKKCDPSREVHEEIQVNTRGDWICFVEWLSYYLNTKPIGVKRVIGEVYLFGETGDETMDVMLKITSRAQDTISVWIRSPSDDMCNHVRKKVSMLKDNLMNFL